MKTTLTVLFLFCAASAFGQAVSSISPTAIPITMSGHPEQAMAHGMADEHSLVGGGTGGATYTSAQGERPLWEFGPVKEEVPLGDVARAYRKEKMTGKKAEIILEKQGS
jgi:hypothetical protein